MRTSIVESISFPTGEIILFGRLCEVDSSGNLHPVQGVSNILTGNSGANGLAGISVFDVAREQALAALGGSAGSGYYNSGEMVPVLRKGRIYVSCDSNVAQTPYARPNVWHPGATDPNTLRGVFTVAATSNTVSAEIAQAPAELVIVRDESKATPQYGAAVAPNYTFVMLLEVNLPGA